MTESRFIKCLKRYGVSNDDIQKTIDSIIKTNLRKKVYLEKQLIYNKKRYDKFNAVS